MMEREAKRNSVIVSIGGGVVQDVTGFLASVVFRGVSWVFVPSTLLAQADSCIGAKTSLNHGRFKNLIGTMYPPDRVVVHTPLLATQGDDHYFSGLGEIVKLHIAKGPGAMASLQRRIERLCARDAEAITTAVRASLLIKRQYIEEDEFDRGPRRLLNFGHCFGHAIESATDFAVPHGQAVVLGMIAAGLAACRRGMLERRRLDEAMTALFTPVLTSRPRFDGRLCRAVVEAMRQDKKRTGAGLAVVLPGGHWRLELVHDFGEGEALAALGELDRVLCHVGVVASSLTPGAQIGGGSG
jgi:3-dehydroquinate synthase